MAQNSTEGTADSTRKRRTPAEIAQAELDKATERVEKAEKRHAKALDEVNAASTEVTRARRFVEFARSNPDLPEPEPEPEPEPSSEDFPTS